MRTNKLLILILVGVCCVIATAQNSFVLHVPSKYVTQEEAYAKVQQLFQGKDVDYFLCNQFTDATLEDESSWTFFVDMEPRQMWSHDAYLISVPKTSKNNIISISSQTALSSPPKCNFQKLNTVERKAAPISTRPDVPENINDSIESEAEKGTFAIIVAGEVSPDEKGVRYWNDCSFIYQTLAKQFNISKDNIIVLMDDPTRMEDNCRVIWDKKTEKLLTD